MISHTPDLESINDCLRTKYWSWTFLNPSDAPRTLLDLFHAELPHIHPNTWAERFDFGGIYINGRAILTDQILPTPCKVEYYEPKFEISLAAQIFPPFKEEYIVYRDEHVLVAYKPAGLSSMPAKEQRHFSMKAYLERYVGKTIHMPSRLDVSTQGLIIASISPEAHAGLQQAFEHRLVDKQYLCATLALPPWNQLTVALPIGRSQDHPVLRAIDHESGQNALTKFSVLGNSESDGTPVTVFSAKPLTGRTHQIRVHASNSGAALLGDRFYGGAPADSLHLVSFSITCWHPITGSEVNVTLPDSLRAGWIKKIR
jgi:tRNA pseudouridine32 synthase/23S rRNA pseudouridine746 synthase